jgi:hypothetical protein
MAPRPGRASWWSSVTTMGHTQFSAASCDPRSSRRSLLRALVLISVAAALHSDAYAQIDTNRFCRDRNPDGYYDCGWFPTRIGAATYTIPGPIKAVQDSTEGGAIGQYKDYSQSGGLRARTVRTGNQLGACGLLAERSRASGIYLCNLGRHGSVEAVCASRNSNAAVSVP